jgi:hypothetical protein
MKALLIVLALALGSHVVTAEEHETKRVCVDVVKDGKPVKDAKGVTKQTCKTVREHKKLETK